jgi:predicted peptidase
LRGQGAPIQYVALRKGTVVPPGQPDNGGGNHVNTWRIAYAIEGVRDWLFEQRR